MPQRLQLLALHGYTLNGAVMRAQLAAIDAAVEETVAITYPDAPHTCSSASLLDMYPSGPPTHAPPYLTWWKASSDGSVYEGWPETRRWVTTWLTGVAASGARAAVLGFSQGAMVAATVAALAARGELPPVSCTVLVAGSLPRAHDLTPLFDEPIDVPSLHVWGLRDAIVAPVAPAAALRFSNDKREMVTWRGPHVVPTRGEGFEAIVSFLRRHA